MMRNPFCSAHLEDMGNAIRRHGYWRYVDSRAEAVRGFAARWLLGTAQKEEINPIVVLMIEIEAKAIRMGLHQDAKKCPLCTIAFITKDRAAPGKQIKGFMEQVIEPLMQSNGLKPGASGRSPIHRTRETKDPGRRIFLPPGHG